MLKLTITQQLGLNIIKPEMNCNDKKRRIKTNLIQIKELCKKGEGEREEAESPAI